MSLEVLTINQRLSQAIAQLKHLNTLESKEKTEERQAINDNKYQELVHQTTQLCRTVHYAQSVFALPYQPQAVLLELLNDLQIAASKGVVEEDLISKSTRKLKPVHEQLQKEWAKHYPSLVGSISATLRTIRKIDPIQVSKCLSNIKNAEVWQNSDSDLLRLQTLSQALSDSNAIIERLNLDEEVAAFLTKMSAGTTTLNDLSDGILTWIRNENLSDKIMLSF